MDTIVVSRPMTDMSPVNSDQCHPPDPDLSLFGDSKNMETVQLAVCQSVPGDAEPFVFNESHHSIRLMAGLRYLRDRSQLFDVILRVEGREFSAHRVVLASCSDYFHAMFTNGLKETSQPCITLNAVTAAAMEQLIHFAYTSKLKITKENVVALLSSASHVQMLPAVTACERYLCDHVIMDNCMVMERLADLYNLSQLTRKVYAFVCRNWVHFIVTSSFTSLTAQQFLAVLQSDFPVFCSEMKVLEAVFIWLDHNTSQRSDTCEDLVRAVHWGNLHVKDVGQLLASAVAERVMRACPRVLTLMLHLFPSLSVLKEIKAPTAQNVSIVKINYCRHGEHLAVKDTQPNAAHGQMDGRDITTCITHSVIRSGTGTQIRNISSSHPQAYLSTIQVNCNLTSSIHVKNNLVRIHHDDTTSKARFYKTYATIPGVVNTRGFFAAVLLVGGFHVSPVPDSSSNDILCFKPGSDKLVGYTTIPHLQQTNFGTAVMNNCLYVVGGSCNEDFTEVTHPYAFSFNTVTSAWTSLPPMAQERCRFYLGSLNGLLYAIGGEVDNSQMLASCEVFDPQRAVWSPVASLPHSRSELAGCALGGNLYLSGGGCTQDTMEQVYNDMWCYNPNTDSWSVKTAMLQARADHSMLVHNNCIYVMGGWSLSQGDRVPVMTVDCYNLESNSWQTVQHMKTARRYCTCTLLHGRVYVIGGGWEGGIPVMEKREVDVLDLETLQWQADVVSVPTVWEHSAVAIYLPRKP